MSNGAISERIDRLERLGVIEGYRAIINPSALGFGMEVIVALRTDQGPSLEDALGQLSEIPELESVRVVTGEWDVILSLRVRDHRHLTDLVLSQVWKVPGFRHSETLLVLDARRGKADWFTELQGETPG
jgi:DNA-binding Lrp family transcriptional regulator